MTSLEQHNAARPVAFDFDASLVAEFSRLRRRLESGDRERRAWPRTNPPTLRQIAETFELTSFERDLLLLCAGVELDHALAERVAALQPIAGHGRPSLALALRVLDNGHLNAWSPFRPLRRWHLLEADSDLPPPLMHLRIDPRVLEALAGIQRLDLRLHSLIELIAPPQAVAPRHVPFVEELVRQLELGSGNDFALRLDHRHTEHCLACTAFACDRLGLSLGKLRVCAIPKTLAKRELAARLLERECALAGRVLAVPMARTNPLLADFLDRLDMPLLLLGHADCANRPLRVLNLP